jgi:hypothetical protein
VHVVDATGQALIDFRWRAAPIAGVICSDFTVREPFTAEMSGSQDLRGYVDVVDAGGRMVARPVLQDRIFVSPRPTEES